MYLAEPWNTLGVMHSGATAAQWRLGRRPGLDGLRGIAVLLVLLAHFDNPATNPFSGAGAVGVTLFFTLSGFLITSLLLEQRERTGRLSFGTFYRRRALRLLPALYATVAAVLLVQWLWHPMGIDRGMFAAVMLSVSNWWQIDHGFTSSLAHTWSLGIEEQFYLVWPALLAVSLRWGRRGAYTVAVIGSLVSIGLVLGGVGDPYHGSFQRAFSLLAGCLLALWMQGRQEAPARRGWVAVLALLAMVPLLPSSDVPAAAYVIGVPILSAVALWGVVARQSPRWLSGPVVRWFGRRSYGIYLWHFMILDVFAFDPASGPWAQASLDRLAISLLVAEASWWVVERPFMRLRNRSRHTGDTVEELDGHLSLGAGAPRRGGEPDVGGHDRAGERGPGDPVDVVG